LKLLYQIHEDDLVVLEDSGANSDEDSGVEEETGSTE